MVRVAVSIGSDDFNTGRRNRPERSGEDTIMPKSNNEQFDEVLQSILSTVASLSRKANKGGEVTTEGLTSLRKIDEKLSAIDEDETC